MAIYSGPKQRILQQKEASLATTTLIGIKIAADNETFYRINESYELRSAVLC